MSCPLWEAHDSRCTYLLSCVRSTHTRTFSLLFGVTTIGAHHLVGSSILDMTPFRSMRRGMGTCLGTLMEKGVEFSVS